VSSASIPSAPADLELIAQLRSKLPYAGLRIPVLEERLQLMRIRKYRAGGEKLSQAQMQLFELEPVVSEMIEQTVGEPAPGHRSTEKSAKHPGRQELPSNLPRVERILPCALDPRVCKRCGKETVAIGYERVPVGCGAGEVFLAGRETGEAGLPVVRGSRLRVSAPAAADHRGVPGERQDHHRYGRR
jgi:hypothetical protein